MAQTTPEIHLVEMKCACMRACVHACVFMHMAVFDNPSVFAAEMHLLLPFSLGPFLIFHLQAAPSKQKVFFLFHSLSEVDWSCGASPRGCHQGFFSMTVRIQLSISST